MEKKIQKILYILFLANEPVPKKDLSIILNISSKTLHKYIEMINESSPTNVISETEKDYIIENLFSIEQLLGFIHKIDFGTNRQKQLLLDLLSSNNGLSIDTLLNRYHISDSTLNNDIRYLKKKASSYDLNISFKQDTYLIVGSEFNKRELMVTMYLYNDYPDNPFINNKEFENDIANSLVLNSYHINDYLLKYILYSLIVIIERQNYYDNSITDLALIPTSVAESIIKILKDKYNITLNENGQSSIIRLLDKTNASYKQSNCQETYSNLTNDIINKIKEKYIIDLNDVDFKEFFITYIMNFEYHYKYGVEFDNPLLFSVKNTFPLCYEIAVYICSIIQDYFNITLSYNTKYYENEVAFLCLHLRKYTDNAYDDSKLKYAFIYPINHKSVDILKNDLQQMCDNLADLCLALPTHESKFYNLEKLDFVVSSDSAFKSADYLPVIYISPFLSLNMKYKFEKFIRNLYKKKRNKQILELLTRIINRDFFYCDIYLRNPIEYIEFLGDKLFRENIISKKFLEDVIRREKIASTDLVSGVAVPHSLAVPAERSFISLIINRKEILWQKDNVRIILLIGISTSDVSSFRFLYEKLTEILTESSSLSKLLSSHDYDSFISTIFDLLT